MKVKGKMILALSLILALCPDGYSRGAGDIIPMEGCCL